MNVYCRNMKGFYLVFALLLGVILCPTMAFSLDNDAWNTGLNFHFFPPGARALGMGGAFVGLADDATAAASNPAGIAQLARMQLAVEGRYISTDSKTSFANTNTPAGRIGWASEEDDIFEPSFGAFATPVFNNLFNIAVFYDRPISFDVTKARAYQSGALAASTTEISLDEVGVSIAKGFADGRIMIGAGLGAQFFSMQSQELSVFNGQFNFAGKVDTDDVGLSYRVGILVKPIENLRVGASYIRNDRFDTDMRYLVADGSTFEVHSSFDVPDNLAIGAAYNILPNWVVQFEAKYVMYSQLMRDFAVDTTYPGGGSNSLADFSMNDALEPHFGTEYVLNAVPNIPIALRAGFYYEPAHDLKYKGDNQVQRALFDGGEDLWHFTFGTGAVFFNHLQVDVGADLTDQSQNVGCSMVYQF